MHKHIAIYSSHKANKKELIKGMLSGQYNLGISSLNHELFSDITLNKFIDEEMRHGHFDVRTSTNNSLKKSSQGERKKALLKHIISKNPECIILDNLYDSLDVESQKNIKNTFLDLSDTVLIVQITNRKQDIFPFINTIYQLENGELLLQENFNRTNTAELKSFTHSLPKPFNEGAIPLDTLISLKNVSLSYGDKSILNNISWTIKQGEFWQLIGPNGSGKSTLAQVLAGHDAYEVTDGGVNFEGKDLLVSAQTGSGKTVGFGLAIGPTILAEDGHFGPAGRPLALCIAPTRELALQVKRELQWLYAAAGAVIASTVSACSFTPASLLWNSKKIVGLASYPLSFE